LDSFHLAPLPAEYEAMLAQVEALLEDLPMREQIRLQAEYLRVKSEENASLAVSLLPAERRGRAHE